MKSRNRDSGETAEPSQTKAGSEAAGEVNNQPGERQRSNGPAVTTPELSKDSGVCRRRSSDVRFGPRKVCRLSSEEMAVLCLERTTKGRLPREAGEGVER